MSDVILVAGGAGYIGSHMVQCLLDGGYTPVVLDNLSAGRREAVAGVTLIEGDVGDAALLDEMFAQHQPKAVMHFASSIQVGESVAKPELYYENNVARTITLINALLRYKPIPFIFSSTAAVYGNPVRETMDESHPHAPLSPYGRSKLMVEQMLADYAHAHDLPYGCLRYFNAAGAHPDGHLGEGHEPETHLIPLILQVASGRRDAIHVFGDDYDTPDGTCIRDYIHVCDLADAHLKLLQHLHKEGGQHHFNLGTGTGHSVREIIDIAQQVTGMSIHQVNAPRRAGDPAVLVADGSAAQKLLQWKPALSQPRIMVEHAWRWEQKLSTKQEAS